MSCILIVEDNADLRDLYTQAVAMEGYRPLAAANGLEALTLLQDAAEKPRLIILDLMMPVMNGWEFLKNQALDSEIADIPVVVCSAAKDQAPSDVMFMHKPVDLDVLLDTVGQYCR